MIVKRTYLEKGKGSGGNPSLQEFCIVQKGLTMQSLPNAFHSLLARPLDNAFRVKRQHTPKWRTAYDETSTATPTGVSLRVPPLANMSENRQTALREELWLQSMAHFGS